MVNKSVKSSSKTTDNTLKSKRMLKLKTLKKVVVKDNVLEPDLSYMKEDKTLKQVEKYVDEKWGNTSQEIIDRKAKRGVTNFQEGELEVMISRIRNESGPKSKTEEISRWVLYILYVIIMLVIIIFFVKTFFS